MMHSYHVIHGKVTQELDFYDCHEDLLSRIKEGLMRKNLQTGRSGKGQTRVKHGVQTPPNLCVPLSLTEIVNNKLTPVA